MQPMELKELGNTGVMIPEIGLGTWRYRGGIEPLRKGIELGATLIDTAEGYNTEHIIGKAVEGMRDSVFIATKVSGRRLGYDDVLRAAEGSLSELGTDYIDLYQVHWPNSSYPIKETMRAMETLVDRGIVRFIGVSNFDLDDLREAEGALRHTPGSVEPGPLQPERERDRKGFTPILSGKRYYGSRIHAP